MAPKEPDMKKKKKVWVGWMQLFPWPYWNKYLWDEASYLYFPSKLHKEKIWEFDKKIRITVEEL